MTTNEDPLEKLLEDKRALDIEVDKLVEAYRSAPKSRRFDLYRSLDKGRAEIELATHWVKKAFATIDHVTKAANNDDGQRH